MRKRGDFDSAWRSRFGVTPPVGESLIDRVFNCWTQDYRRGGMKADAFLEMAMRTGSRTGGFGLLWQARFGPRPEPWISAAIFAFFYEWEIENTQRSRVGSRPIKASDWLIARFGEGGAIVAPWGSLTTFAAAWEANFGRRDNLLDLVRGLSDEWYSHYQESGEFSIRLDWT